MSGGSSARLIAKERIMLHLLDYTKYRDAMEVPPEMTQEGLAAAGWIDLRHLSQYLRPLLRENLVRERTSHVKGVRQRRKVYDLTEAGQHAAYRMRDRLKAESVRVQDEHGIRNESLGKVLETVGGQASLLDLVRRMQPAGTLDLRAALAAPTSRFVERLDEAPRLERFIGRRTELEVLTAGTGTAKVFVVRGVAGIGKSSVAAKACEVLRGQNHLFWHTLRPWDTPVSLLTALGEFLSSVGHPGLRAVLGRGEVAQATAVLREDLPGLKAFLVFDDAQEAAEEILSWFRFLKEAIALAPDVKALFLTRRSLPFYDRRDVSLAGLVKEIDLVGLSTDEIEAFLSPDRDTAAGHLGRALGGHPLFLQLVRSSARGPIHEVALRDMHRFLEEEVYADLSDAERTALKTASLYRVPVPRDALCSDASVTHDVVLSLTNRALLRIVGADAIEAHDTIRGYFEEILTPSEREGLSRFAASRLRSLASEAHGAGNFVACIDYLSNALKLSMGEDDRIGFLEALGDEHDKIGDFPAALTMYKEALHVSKGFDVQARLHRKIAAALETRGELAAAAEELTDCRRALGDAVTPERGWADLIQSRIASQQEDAEKAREAGRSALDVFETFHDVSSIVRTLYELGYIEVDAHPGNLADAERFFQRGLELASTLGDRELTAKLHTALAHLYAGRLGAVDRALEHMAAVEADADALRDLQVLRSFRMLQAWFHLDIRGDIPTAERYFLESADLARKIHYASSVTFTQYGRALCHYFQGSVEQARDELKGFARDILAQGSPAFAVEGFLLAAECDLRLGDLEDFHRIEVEVARPELAEGRKARPVRVMILKAINSLLDDDLEGAQSAFDEALRLCGEGDMIEEALLLHLVHFYCGIALRVCGKRREGDEHLARAREYLDRYHLKARLSILEEAERELSETLARAVGRPHRLG